MTFRRRSAEVALVKLPVKVVPSSSRDGIAGWLGDALRVRVRAPAERGKANVAAVRVIAETIGVPPESVRVVKGHTAPYKVIEISGLTEVEVQHRLAKAAP